MDNASLLLLSSIVFLPAVAALVLALVPSGQVQAIRFITLGTTIMVFLLTIIGLVTMDETRFSMDVATMQSVFNVSWIPSFDIDFFMGLDGISFPLLMLTAFVTMLSMGASWSIEKHVKGYCILFLLLETGMLGVFLALDFFLFYVFWEVMLLPMYFLIGVWGGPRREYAAIKFFLYTLVGSVFMLIAILMLYFASDLREVARQAAHGKVDWSELHVNASAASKSGVRLIPDQETRQDARLLLVRGAQNLDRKLFVSFQKVENATETAASYDDASNTVTVALADGKSTASEVAQAITTNPLVSAVLLARAASPAGGPGEILPGDSTSLAPSARPVHTFNLLALAAMGQQTKLFSQELLWGWTLQQWAFLLLFVGFIIKVPSVPLHTWLPDAHVEAPTPISMILAGVLLKMGGYGIIRICYPICPEAAHDWAFYICLLGVVSMVYGGFAALAQKDFKRMVAYSSVSHMGYVVLGLGVWSATAGTVYDPYYWNMGVKGAMFQMIAHGISSPGMFFMVGIVYDRVHHRELDRFGGLYHKMPVYTALAIGLFFAGLGLPGLCGFVGEVLVVLSVWKFSITLAVISAAVVVITAAYILWAIQRVYLGAEYRGPHEDHLTPSNLRENLIGVVLLGLAIVMGVFPYQTVLRYMDSTIDRQVNTLSAWTRTYESEQASTEAVTDNHSVASEPEFVVTSN